MSDELLFADENTEAAQPDNQRFGPWNILVVDDEPSVHEVTRLVLSGFHFDGRPLQLISAMNAKQAREILASRDDIALALLDVVMETEHAGLDLARYIREDLGNHYTRIVLRTGQPGAAPEEEVIRAYDINDYKDKTELTRTRLTTLFFSALRSYRDICLIDASMRGLERVIQAINEVSEAKTLGVFASALLEQITGLLGLSGDAVYLQPISAWAKSSQPERSLVLAATGTLSRLLDPEDSGVLPAEVDRAFAAAIESKTSVHGAGHFVGYYRTARGAENLLYVSHSGELGSLDRKLLEIYSANVSITYETLLLKEEIEETQKELVFILGGAVETRSKETGAHVRRVGLICEMLAYKSGLDPELTELIKLAAPLHDVGKIGIPDAILNKPGRHNEQESEIMRTHARIGFDMLCKSERRILQLGAIIAHEHHERWDGTGYPRGLAGEDIDIAGRLACIADVVDALLSTRCYKEPWDIDGVQHYCRAERGRLFDPRLTDLLLENFDALLEIRRQHPDEVTV